MPKTSSAKAKPTTSPIDSKAPRPSVLSTRRRAAKPPEGEVEGDVQERIEGVERRQGGDRREELDRRAFPPRPEGRRQSSGRRSTDPQRD